jgi:hypothetical protein
MTFEPDHGAATAVRPPWWRRAISWRPSVSFRRTGTASPQSRSRRVLKWGVGILIAAFVLYYPLGALIVENIDDDPQFAPRNTAPGESRAVAVAADLVTREVDVHQWTPMQPFFMPAGILDNMPNYQRGIMAALGRFSTEMMDQLGRTRGSSQTDRDLEQARGFLNEQPNIWIWQPSVSLLPSATSAQKYRAGRDKLIAYYNKGRLYANYLLMRELGRDFDAVIKEKGLTNAWNGTVDTFRTAAELDPWVVWNGYPDGFLIPNHLAAQGFYLLRARTQLREISAILLK